MCHKRRLWCQQGQHTAAAGATSDSAAAVTGRRAAATALPAVTRERNLGVVPGRGVTGGGCAASCVTGPRFGGAHRRGHEHSPAEPDASRPGQTCGDGEFPASRRVSTHLRCRRSHDRTARDPFQAVWHGACLRAAGPLPATRQRSLQGCPRLHGGYGDDIGARNRRSPARRGRTGAFSGRQPQLQDEGHRGTREASLSSWPGAKKGAPSAST